MEGCSMSRGWRADSTPQITLQITLGHPLDPPVGMHRSPLGERRIVGQQSMSGWTMRRLENKADRHPVRTVARHRESHGIEVPLLGKSRTTRGVSQIAQFPQLLMVRLGALLTGGPALPSPTRTEREPRRVKPATIVTATFGHEKGTGHHSSKRRLFYSGKAGLATVEESSASGAAARRHFRARAGRELRGEAEPESPRGPDKIVAHSPAGLLS